LKARYAPTPASIVWQLKQNPKWRPPNWKGPIGESIQIDSFLDLAAAVGLADAANPSAN
jgi:hypothetical protein